MLHSASSTGYSWKAAMKFQVVSEISSNKFLFIPTVNMVLSQA